MGRFNIVGSLVVGMDKIGNYNLQEFSRISVDSRLYFIAYFNFIDIVDDDEQIHNKIIEIKKLGYKGLKIHPRFAQLSITDKRVIKIIKICSDYGLIVLLCTYFCGSTKTDTLNSLQSLRELLIEIGENKILLLHGGTVNLLSTIEICLPYPKVLVDLSYTLCKYEGSSIDLDIRWAFNNFDRRLCIGSDYPEFSIKKLRERFDYFSEDICLEKIENIAYKNITNFLNE
jgi:predicted TIM-barrel fold metal-dependent hydrolase